MNMKDIKLIIWDLDETFWNGTLSDGTIHMIEENVELVRNAVDSGVMCSICSKNDESEVKKALEKDNLWDLFVFVSINWTPKGERVHQIINEMGLREPNVLFIDDNPSNRAEVKAACPNIIVEDERIIPLLSSYFRETEKKDISHKRLNQYKILEKKQMFKAKFASNEDFLLNSKIIVQFHDDCLSHLDRIEDLVMRSNQLNFTKLRSNKSELNEILNDQSIKSGYITVIDDYGDYGIVGFFAIKDNAAIHFTFSCRILNMGVEQYVYKELGKPKIQIVGDVSSNLESIDPYWINCTNAFSNQKQSLQHSITKKIVLKGPCDIGQIFAYIKDNPRMIKEFTYVSNRGINIEGRNHTEHILQYMSVKEEDISRICNQLPFGDPLMYKTSMFDDDIYAVVFSLFTDPNLGLYREKKSGIIVAFGEWINDLTDINRWQEYLNNDDERIFLANWKPTREELERIRNAYEFIGRATSEHIFQNIQWIYNKIDKSTKLLLCLGSETPYLKNTQVAYKDRAAFNSELNKLIREWAKTKENVYILDFNLYIHGQDDFTDNINHFSRRVYYQMAQDIVSILGNDDKTVRNKSYVATEMVYNIKNVLRPIYRKLITKK